jgi:hypothetical protein
VEFWRTILVLLRRRSVALPVLLLPLGVAAATYLVTPIQYRSSETIVLTSSTNGSVLPQDPTSAPPQVNPLRNFDGMKTAVSILIQVLSTRDVANQLGAVEGGPTTFTVSDGSVIPHLLGASGPFMVIEGYSTSSMGARDIVVRVAQRLRDELVKQQRSLNAPPSTFMGMIDVVPPSAPEAQVTTKLKVAAGALVFGLIASIGVAYFAYRLRAAAVTKIPLPYTGTARHAEAPKTSAALNSAVGAEPHGT